MAFIFTSFKPVTVPLSSYFHVLLGNVTKKIAPDIIFSWQGCGGSVSSLVLRFFWHDMKASRMWNGLDCLMFCLVSVPTAPVGTGVAFSMYGGLCF